MHFDMILTMNKGKLFAQAETVEETKQLLQFQKVKRTYTKKPGPKPKTKEIV